jgi:hypothetical protein
MTAEIIKTAAYICIGTELRMGARRLKADRREMLRYEPDKDNRRLILERRQASAVWDKLGARD